MEGLGDVAATGAGLVMTTGDGFGLGGITRTEALRGKAAWGGFFMMAEALTVAVGLDAATGFFVTAVGVMDFAAAGGGLGGDVLATGGGVWVAG